MSEKFVESLSPVSLFGSWIDQIIRLNNQLEHVWTEV